MSDQKKDIPKTTPKMYHIDSEKLMRDLESSSQSRPLSSLSQTWKDQEV